MSIAAYPKYSSFKPSRFDWIENVPDHWDVEKLGSMLTAVSQKNKPDLPLLSITREQGVIKRDVENQESNHNFIPDDLSGYKVLRKGQFGMNKMKAWQGSYGVSEYTGIVSPAYFVFDFAREVDPHFFNVAVRGKLYISYFGSASDGVRIGQWDLNQARMRQIPILLPPLPEQRAISAFLDGKCAKIDEAVRIKEEQIKLLRERRQILIQQAVTRGLNPGAPMKHSGMDWIGQIPEHWEVRKVKQLFRLVVDAAANNNSHELLSIYTDIGVRPRKDLEERGNKASTTDGYWTVKKGDFIVNKLLAWMGAIGLSDYDGVTSPAYDILRPRVSLNGQFFHRLFRSKSFSSEIKRFSRGIMEMRLRIYFDKLGALVLPLPPQDEQDEIISFLDEHEQKIDTAISIKENQIAALKEYKTTLTNAAVTGKIKII